MNCVARTRSFLRSPVTQRKHRLPFNSALLKHNKHATALISTVIVNHEISPKNEEKKKIKSAAMLTFQELLLFSDKVFKKKNPTYMTREVETKWAK